MHRFTLAKLSLVLSCLMLVTGCGKNNGKLVEVEGKIQFADGQPLPKGTRLYLLPATGKMGGGSAVTGEDGSFKVTHESGSTGAALGKYTVQLAAPENDASFFKMIPKDYYEGGMLTIEVKEDMKPVALKVTRLHQVAKK